MPAHMPGWAKDLTIATQAVMDGQYLHGPGGLDNFYDQAEAWIQTQTITRANAADPKHYVPEPFKMTIPRRQVVVYDEDGNMSSSLAQVDPNIHMPEMPPYVETTPTPAPAGPALPAATAPDPLMTQMMAAVMAKLVAIEQRLITVIGKA
jgi:hypothetical protein